MKLGAGDRGASATVVTVDEEMGRATAPESRWAVRLLRGPWLGVALVVALFGLPLFVGLGATDLQNDEAIYSFAVDVMLRDGDWLTPKSSPNEHEPFFEKPPLKFWIVALPMRLGLLPSNEFGLRFWDAVFGCVAFLYVFATGRRLAGSACGLAAVLVLFAERPLLFEHGLRGNNMEAAVVLAYCAAVYHFLAWRTSEHSAKRRFHVIAVGLFFVLGFMTKFVAALFLPMVLGAAVLARRNERARLARDWRIWGASALVAVLLIAPWFAYQYYKVGSEFWRVMFGAHVFERFTAYLDPGHLNPWHYYFTTLAAELRASGTMIIAVIGMVAVLVRLVRRGWFEGAVVLLWFWLPLGLISAGSSKLYHYAYPFLPPVALCAGYGAHLVLRGVQRLFDAPLVAADRRLRAATRRLSKVGWVRVALLAVAAGAVGVAAATVVLGGQLRVGAGDITLLRNTSVVRPLLVALVALTLAGRLFTAGRAVVPFAVLLLLPVGTYRRHVGELAVENHPLRSVRDCVQPIAARHATDDPRGPGVYVEHGTASHSYHYYLGGIGRWLQRDVSSDPTVYTALYVPGTMRPVLLSTERERQFTELVAAGDEELLSRAARKANMSVEALRKAASRVEFASLTFPGDVLLLPGPYSPCGFVPGTEGVR